MLLIYLYFFCSRG